MMSPLHSCLGVWFSDIKFTHFLQLKSLIWCNRESHKQDMGVLKRSSWTLQTWLLYTSICVLHNKVYIRSSLQTSTPSLCNRLDCRNTEQLLRDRRENRVPMTFHKAMILLHSLTSIIHLCGQWHFMYVGLYKCFSSFSAYWHVINLKDEPKQQDTVFVFSL